MVSHMSAAMAVEYSEKTSANPTKFIFVAVSVFHFWPVLSIFIFNESEFFTAVAFIYKKTISKFLQLFTLFSGLLFVISYNAHEVRKCHRERV
jgi:hypothetical protein